ncbi:MAG: hypothetical protein WDO71_14240 [Bacteroidota bacterium]
MNYYQKLLRYDHCKSGSIKAIKEKAERQFINLRYIDEKHIAVSLG